MTDFWSALKKARKYMTNQQYRTLKGQALNGDIEGAVKGLQKLMRKRGVSNDR